MMQNSDSESEVNNNHPLIDAINGNDFDQVKYLINSNQSLNKVKVNGIPLLTLSVKCAVETKRWEIFEYLLQQNIDLDVLVNKVQRNTVLMEVTEEAEERYLLALIDKGANVNHHNAEGDTFLHQAVFENFIMSAQAAIEKGADVNAANNRGETPLFIACLFEQVECVHMLLYYGAIATIPTHQGELPLTTHRIPELSPLLFEHTFDEESIKISLPVLVDDLKSLSVIVHRASEIVYDFEDLEYLEECVGLMTEEKLRFFVKEFKRITRDFVDFCIPWEKIVQKYNVEDLNIWTMWSCLESVLNVFLDSEFVDQCVRKLPKNYPSIGFLVSALAIEGVNLDKATKFVCILLSHGAEVTSCDLDMVYEVCGFCELFKILLHMDILPLGRWDEREPYSYAILYYEMDTDLDELLNRLPITGNLLKYFNRQSLKNKDIFINPRWTQYWREKESSTIQVMLKNLVTVPCLVELSRDAARKFIIKRYKVKNSKQFYTILNWLPIDKYTMQIIGFEKELYKEM